MTKKVLGRERRVREKEHESLQLNEVTGHGIKLNLMGKRETRWRKTEEK